MPEIGRIARKQAASLAGLAPMTRESGVWKGKAFIQGGRKVVRNALYMPAIVAIRHNPDFKTKYQSMINAGKPPKVLTSGAIVGSERATELFEAAYDEHARRLAKLYKNLGNT